MAGPSETLLPRFEIAVGEEVDEHLDAGSDEDEEGSEGAPGEPSKGKKRKRPGGKGRRKIPIEYIHEKNKRAITFSKRKAGIFSKARELSTLTGSSLLLLVVSESGVVYTYTTEKFRPLVSQSAGKSLIAACLNGTVTLSDSDPPLRETKRGGQIVLKDAFRDASASQTPSTAQPQYSPNDLAGSGPPPGPASHASPRLPPLPPGASTLSAPAGSHPGRQSVYVPSFPSQPFAIHDGASYLGAGTELDASNFAVASEAINHTDDALRGLRRSLSIERRFEEQGRNEVPYGAPSIGESDVRAGRAENHPHPSVSFTQSADAWAGWHNRFGASAAPSLPSTASTSNSRASAGLLPPELQPRTSASGAVPKLSTSRRFQPLSTGTALAGSSQSHAPTAGPAPLASEQQPIPLDPSFTSDIGRDRDGFPQSASGAARPGQADYILPSKRTRRSSNPGTGAFDPDSDLEGEDFSSLRQAGSAATARESGARHSSVPPGNAAGSASSAATTEDPLKGLYRTRPMGEEGHFSLFDRMDYSSEAFRRIIELQQLDAEKRAAHERTLQRVEEEEERERGQATRARRQS